MLGLVTSVATFTEDSGKASIYKALFLFIT